jgi:uncharacterized protein (TIGR02145 family)
MNSKTFITLIFLMILIFPVSAQKVSQHKARVVATNYSSGLQQAQGNKAYAEIKFSDELALTQNEDTLLYVFNYADNKGFIIVSADDRITPVLGFSPNGQFEVGNHPPSFSSLLNRQMEYVRQASNKDFIASSKIAERWKKVLEDDPTGQKSEITILEPLLPILWNQGCGFNAWCPEDPDGQCGRVWTGCVATAMGQIMKYWNYPDTGRGSNAYPSRYGKLEVDFSQQQYDWDAMPLTGHSNEVAKLLYHVGVAVEMDYQAHESAAYSYKVRNALTDFFRYSFKARHLSVGSYTEDQLIDIITSELKEERVLYYASNNGDQDHSGHAFVIDGYMSYMGHYLFSINFGWSGNYSGWYYLQDLETGGMNFNHGVSLITGISAADCPVMELPFSEDFESSSSFCWQSFNRGSKSFNWEENEGQNRTPGGSKSAIHSYWAMTDQPEESYLLSPPIRLPSNPGPGVVLSFWSKNFCPDLYTNGKNSVLVSVDDGETFTQVWAAEQVENKWLKTKVNLNAYAGKTIRIAFLYEKFNLPGAHTWHLDDIRVALDHPEPPEVASLSVFDITGQSAKAIGRILYQGHSAVTSRGIIWGTQAEPTLENNTGKIAEEGTKDIFKVTLSGLTAQTTYYVRAWATNGQGTSYGNVMSFVAESTPFVCGESTVTDIDGNVYATVMVGNQCWMGENLKTTHYRNGMPINNPNCIVNFMNTEWGADQDGAWLAWNNAETFREKYGAIYNHHAVRNENTLCPAQWHVPHDQEWMHLEQSLGMSGDITGVMGWRGDNEGAKLAGGENLWKKGNLTASNYFGSAGFNALPTGWYPFTTFGSGNVWPDSDVAWWSSTTSSMLGATIARRISHDQTGIERNARTPSQGHYVRCLRNEPTVNTWGVRDVTTSKANIAGTARIFFQDEEAQISRRGLVWSHNHNPTLETNHGKIEFQEESNTFYHELTNLQPRTAYYVRAFADNSLGRVYGNEVKFYTLGPVVPCPGSEKVTDADGNNYNTLLIGDQCWLRENLAVTKNHAGQPIERVCLDGNEQNCQTLGGLYTWSTILDGYLPDNDNVEPIQGICPTGWSLPDDNHWDELTHHLIHHGYNYDHTLEKNLIAQSLSASQSWISIGMMPTGSPGAEPSKNNSAGFAALPAGGRNHNLTWMQQGISANFWSASSYGQDMAGYRSISFRERGLISDTINVNAALSVRCVKTSPNVNVSDILPEETFFTVYPNPGSGLFTLALHPSQIQCIDCAIFVIDALGRVLMVNQIQDNGTYPIDLSNEPAGIYHVKVISSNRVGVIKLFKR